MLYLEAVYNLSLINECIPELCRHGLLNSLSEIYSFSTDPDLIRLSAKIIDKIVSKDVFIIFVVQKWNINRHGIQNNQVQ